ncbi:MAG: hypothetical protein F6K41_34065 [Symploca sp. SIO3E6]|nr:hypothetical protein [Caldora sp. SIO3E6]
MTRKVKLTGIGLGISLLIGFTAEPVVSSDNSQLPMGAKQQLAGAHGGSSAKSFLGLWKTVDPLDGGMITASITDNDQDGTLELRLSDTFIRVCQPAAGSPKTGRGIYEGSGTVVSSNLLDVTATVKCFDSNNAVVDSLTVDWEFKLVGDTVEFTGTGLGDNTAIFHKISH